MKTEKPIIILSLINRVHLLCFGIGFALSSATQLRFINNVLGLSEVLLIFAIILSAIKFANSGARVSGIGVHILFFLLVSVFLLALGFLSAKATDYEVLGAGHDVVAYLFVASLLCAFCQLNAFEVKKVIKTSIFVGVVLLAGLYVLAQSYSSILGVDFWLGRRFKGWADNPNQLGLYFSSMPFLLLYFACQENSIARKLCYLIVLFVSLLLGYFTYSDALHLAWGVGLSTLLFFLFVRGVDSIVPSERGLILKLFILISVLFLLGFSVFLLFADLNEAALVMSESEGNQGAVRLAIWANSISAIFESPYIGWGPGAHSGIEYPHDNFEAHNSFLDWGASTGFTGLVMLFGFVLWILKALIKERSGFLLSGLIALIITSMFHHYLRQPLFWFYLLAPLALVKPASLHVNDRSNI
jgi:O-antigen ligase